MSQPVNAKNLLGDFLLTKKLGEGGMGRVYKARQLSMDRDVALKILSKHLARDPGFVERFNREARATGMLDHPNIVRGIAIGEERGFHYFAMELIDGETTDRIISEYGQFSVGDALHIGLEVARALEYAHSRDMVHRDIKPDNIMVTRNGSVKLADLGLAKAMEEDLGLTQTGSGFGTPHYMAPEQARNAKHADHRSDIYALGVTMYQLLTGALPFDGETAIEVLSAKQEGRHTPARRRNPEVPEILDLILDKMMAPEPNRRFQSTSEVAESLEKTALASSSLDILTAQPTRLNGEATSRSEAALHATATNTSSQASVIPYFIRYKDRRGKLVRKRGDKHQVRDLIRRGWIGTDVEGSRNPDGPYRPLFAFPEFNDVMKSRMIKEKGDAVSGGGMAGKFAQLEKEQNRRMKIREIKRRLKRAVGPLIMVGILFTGVYYAGKYWQHLQAERKSTDQQNRAESLRP